MPTFEELKAQFAQRTATADVLLNQELRQRHEALDLELAKAHEEDPKYNREPTAPAISRQINALEEEIAAAYVTFTFQGIGNGAWLRLQVKYPPDRAAKAVGFDFDPEQFPVHAVAASCIDPVLEPDEVRFLWTNLPDAEWSKLWRACLTVNLGESNRPKSLLAMVDRLARDASSTIAEPTASPGPSSSDE